MHGPGEPLAVCELELAPPGPDEVLVRILATGICRSDLSYIDGKWPTPLPIVLGHEGAGMIEAVGDGVPGERVGEPVVLTFSPACGRCRLCLAGRSNLCLDAARGLDSGFLRDGTSRLSLAGRTVHHLAYVSSFATHAVVPADAALTVDAELDPALGCLLGCGVTTGVMSVTRRAAVRPGESVAVFGCGGVGLAAVLGAHLVSALPIVAVDPVPFKRELAARLGATHVIDPADGDPAAQVRAITTDGVDFAFEALGRPEVAEQAFRSVRDGGTTVLIGQPPMGVKAGFDVYAATQFEHTILGSNLGGAVPALHIPQLARLAVAGLLDLAPLVTHRFTLDDINEAVAMTASGEAGRVVVMPFGAGPEPAAPHALEAAGPRSPETAAAHSLDREGIGA
jgi:S-(hydroxymethyl)glutathione dehydrogenase/alcohol dehydrogenase